MIDLKENPRRQWSTPQALVDAIGRAYIGGPFELDVAVSASNAKAPHYYDVTMNGLIRPWSGRVWLNPPYDEITPWVDRAISERHACTAIVALLAARTDQPWFHAALKVAREVVFLQGRVQFEPPDATIKVSSNREPSLLLIFDALKHARAKISSAKVSDLLGGKGARHVRGRRR